MKADIKKDEGLLRIKFSNKSNHTNKKGIMKCLTIFTKQFKSGTDIRGVASEGVEGQSVNLTDDVVADMADGFCALAFLKKVSKKVRVELKISVGRCTAVISGPQYNENNNRAFLSGCGAERSLLSGLRQLRQCL